MDNIAERIDSLKSVTEIASDPGNAQANDYLHGMANGLILAQHIMTAQPGKECPYIEAAPRDIRDELRSRGIHVSDG